VSSAASPSIACRGRVHPVKEQEKGCPAAAVLAGRADFRQPALAAAQRRGEGEGGGGGGW